MHEILQKMTATAASALALATAVVAGISVPASAAAANARGLSGAQIKARIVGNQLTDQVHYRFVFDRDGTLRSYSMGTRKIGKWSIEKNELCLETGDSDDGCYSVTLRGERFEFSPSGLGTAFDGIVEPVDRKEGGKT